MPDFIDPFPYYVEEEKPNTEWLGSSNTITFTIEDTLPYLPERPAVTQKPLKFTLMEVLAIIFICWLLFH